MWVGLQKWSGRGTAVAIVAILAAFLVNFTIISFLPFGRRPKCPDPVYHRDEKQGIEAPLGRREAAGIIESFRLTPELKVMEMWDPADYDSMWPLAWEHLIENTSVSNLPCGRGDSMPTTSQDMLASGFIYFKNLYFLNNTFFLVEQASATERTLHAEHWIKDWPGTARRNFGVSVVQGWEAVCNVTKSTDSVRHIERAIMITDFLPKYEPHLYHMLENMLGAWATLDHFLPADVERHTWPEFLILPQNNQQEFGIGGATISLIHAIFPRIRIMDEDRFTKISSVGSGVQLREVVASDRSGCDHGGVNQMIAAMTPHLPKHTWKMAKVVCGSCLALYPRARGQPTVTFVDRQMAGNRRLDHKISRELLWLLGTRAPFFTSQWVRFESLSFCQQIKLAASSDVLMGVHGNGLSHALWVSRPGALIEIFPGSGQRMVAFQQFAEAVGLLYFGLDSGTGKVHRENSCQFPVGCEIDGKHFNTIVEKIDLEQVVCLVCQAIAEAGIATGLPPCTFCGPVEREEQEHQRVAIPSCASAQREIQSRSGHPLDDFGLCYHKGKNYTCTDLRPRYFVGSADDSAPSVECLGGSLSWATCGNGEFLCLRGAEDSMYRRFLRKHGVVTASAAARITVERKVVHKLCILLPFRDGCSEYSLNATGQRTAHLNRFLLHMRDFFHGRNVDFIVVHQSTRGLFNKALLFNVGANLAERRGCDYVALHDIDHLPLHPMNTYAWPHRPIHLCTNSSDVGWETFTGGAVLLSLKDFVGINGMSNLYEGWGAEDADLYQRIVRGWGSVERLDPVYGHYLPLNHERDQDPKAHHANMQVLERLQASSGWDVIDHDGYNQLQKNARLLELTVEGDLVVAGVEVQSQARNKILAGDM
eukprot:CAMPEP_0180138354 /NCGR_PEP_ID=MMETSP0986-20121125/12823_1 /TAXON_ID=697907 /ORGANISM="non described non described, Strain CCMP2293" /LENGTH=875 /DNA_ID=CAMNT_0022080121 /DNA_START=217 /DNA_END=2845 /DNA_ORIENTATION=+